ncbi:MAG TPA: L,D-transpeptidase family protein [Myxococcota bacterium]|nr:L,D-transpeptidase family protein [Myxococcota bacterium]
MHRAAAAFAATFLLCATARAQAPAPDTELVRERVELLRASPEPEIDGVRIAAQRLLSQLYERRGFALEWTAPAASDDLARAIRDIDADGLDPEDYLRTPLERARAAALAPNALAQARVDWDLLQTEALVRLLYHLILGKVDPRTFDANWNFTREIHRDDPAGFVQSIIDSSEVYARIQREKPDHDLYRKLVAAYARERAAAEGWKPVPGGPTLKTGVTDSRVAELRARLVASGDLEPGAASGDAYDSAVEAAVKSFQTRHGLGADGGVGPATLAALNEPPTARLTQLRVNLERGRSLLHDLPATFVVVNVAGFEVYFVRDDSVVWRARAQVGKPYRATPIFRSEMSYLVVNPTWTVPPGIFANDVLPQQKRDPSTLAKKGLEVVDADGRVVPASSIDWAKVTPRNFRYMLRQPAGPTNALGRVKFMFPNSHSVYLHDTPSKNLFDRDDRAFSSGCIRVENPFELAAYLLEGQKGWSRADLDAAVAAGKTRTITLAQRVPVLLLYWTAWVEPDGKLQLRRDLYGRDAKVAAALAEPFHIRRPAANVRR